MFLVTSPKNRAEGDGTEDGSGDEDEGRFRRQGWRTVTETGRRTVPETRMEDGSGDEDGERFRRRGWRTATCTGC